MRPVQRVDQGQKRKAEFGDFQTPLPLARKVCALLQREFGHFDAVLEPTCGVGNLLVAAQEHFGAKTRLLGLERSAAYLDDARAKLGGGEGIDLRVANMFEVDWRALMQPIRGRLLVLGNPPWVTNAQLGALDSQNLPKKTRQAGLSGLAATLGQSNFDLSEWLLARLVEDMPPARAWMAMLVKRSVARKVLDRIWRRGAGVREARVYGIDAQRHFGASVDACLFCWSGPGEGRACAVYGGLDEKLPERSFGEDKGLMVADLGAWAGVAHLRAKGGQTRWRSGIKHDCAKVLELRPDGAFLRNGWGEAVDVEPECLFPLVKSSDLAHGRDDGGKRLIVPQRTVGAKTCVLAQKAPRLWAYLSQHREGFEGRKSRVYRGKPGFSIFGVGDYSFAPWKVAISGLYKRMAFQVHGPVDGKPVLFDDTVYFLPFAEREHAMAAHAWLCSPEASAFFEALVFRESKRPVTAKLLGQLEMRGSG